MTGNERDGNRPDASIDGTPRHSRRFSDELVEDARRVFQKRTTRTLTNEDARQMLENLVGYFTVLHEWDRARSGRPPDGSADSNAPDSQV